MNVVGTFALTLLAIMATVVHFSVLFHKADPQVQLKLNSIDKFRQLHTMDGGTREQAQLTLDVDADVRTAFTWNTKQLYVFVAAEYSTPERPSNKVILWDEVLNSKEEGLFRLRARRSDYPLVDPYNGLKGNDVKLTFGYCVMPYNGNIFVNTTASHVVTFPTEYI